jgi:hypothetical protein
MCLIFSLFFQSFLNTYEVAKNLYKNLQFVDLVSLSIHDEDRGLQPLSCDPSESQKHANNPKYIKSFLTDLKTCDESLTMTQFLQLINLSYEDYILQSGLLLDQILCFSNELQTSYVLTTIMFTV